MPKFEIAVYNAEVRRRVLEGGHHRQLSDDWGEIRYIEITAPDKAAAASKARAMYGETNGYVIEAVTPMGDD